VEQVLVLLVPQGPGLFHMEQFAIRTRFPPPSDVPRETVDSGGTKEAVGIRSTWNNHVIAAEGAAECSTWNISAILGQNPTPQPLFHVKHLASLGGVC
jgi:hypothetical protein